MKVTCSVSKDMKKNNNKRRIATYLLVNLLTLIIKDLKISVEQGMLVTTLNINKNNNNPILV